MSTQFVFPLLEKMKSEDKDFRYMALNDLMAGINKGRLVMDERLENKIVASVLQLVEDNNGEVQNLAVQCLAVLINHLLPKFVEQIVRKLCDLLLGDDEQKRDIASIGTKTLLSKIDEQGPNTGLVCETLIKAIVPALSKSNASDNLLLECLDVLSSMLSTYGELVSDHLVELQKALVPLLEHSRAIVRKRAIGTLTCLVPYATPAMFEHIVTLVIGKLEARPSSNLARTFATTLGTIARDAGANLAPYVDKAFGLVLSYAKAEEDDDELTEACMQALEHFVTFCGDAVMPHFDAYMELSLEKLTYDPNYNDDEDEEMDDEEDEEEDEEFSDDEFSDDDDMSWKVRRAAAKCLVAAFKARPERLTVFYSQAAPPLVNRFKEREENVRLDVFNAFSVLLQQTLLLETGRGQTDMDTDITGLNDIVDPAVNKLRRQLKDKSIKIRQGALNVLTSLVQTKSNALVGHAASILPGALFCATDKTSNTNLKADTLKFVSAVLQNHEATTFDSEDQNVLCDIISRSIEDPFFKINADALSLTAPFGRVLRADVEEPVDASVVPLVDRLFKAVKEKFEAADADQEVKERAILAMSDMLARFGDVLVSHVPSVLATFLTRLDNEITRVTATKALGIIANSALRIDLSPILNDALSMMSTFLRKTSRPLRLAALETLRLVLNVHGGDVAFSNITEIVAEAPGLISSSDIQVASLAIRVVAVCAAKQPELVPRLQSDIAVVPTVASFVASSVIQGAALEHAVQLLTVIAAAKVTGLVFADMRTLLLSAMHDAGALASGSGPSKQSVRNIAYAMTAVASQDSSAIQGLVVDSLRTSEDASAATSDRALALHVLGYAGSTVDITSFGDVSTVLNKSLADKAEEVSSAASQALGHATAFNVSAFLPAVVSGIEKGENVYQHLVAVKSMLTEIVSRGTESDALVASLDQLWAVMVHVCTSAEQTVRNVVAECLGRIVAIDVAKMESLASLLRQDSPAVRSTAVAAVKTAVLVKRANVEAALRPHLPQFVGAVGDSDNVVRRAALIALNSVLHTTPALLADTIEDVMQQLYNETVVRPELIREVEMGPFKHRIDEGADTRKAAYECMYTALEVFPARIGVSSFLEHLLKGLGDEYDIQMLAFLMVSQASKKFPNDVLLRMDDFVKALSATFDIKLKSNAVQQEVEKTEELKKTAVRAVYALTLIPGSDKSPALRGLIEKLKSLPNLSERWDELQGREAGQGEVSAMDTTV